MKNKLFKTASVALLIACILLISCRQSYAPKPQPYFRIDFPEREYRMYDSICPFTFEYPIYGMLTHENHPTFEPCWININFPKYKGTIHLSYNQIENNFDSFIEDNWKILFKGLAQKADAIDGQEYINLEKNVYGMIYDIRGNSASAVQFYVTDSVRNVLRGSLYFFTRPNQDSLAPVVKFFREDMIYLMETVKWKE